LEVCPQGIVASRNVGRSANLNIELGPLLEECSKIET
jgi:hypothetical protein